MLKIAEAATEEDIESAKTLFVEYADSLGFDLSFQGFDEELKNLRGDYGCPWGLPVGGCMRGAGGRMCGTETARRRNM